MPDFEKFRKIPRLSRNCVITEKIDGTNAQIMIDEDLNFFVGSRNRWLEEGKDNHVFLKWAMDHKDELMKLGVGRHYGEWWGEGIQRRYGIKGKRFSLFNTFRWTEETLPKCCHVVPVLYEGIFDTMAVDMALNMLDVNGSVASPGFMRPEGVVIWHESGRVYFKKTIKDDEQPKSLI